jgi:DinB superfamily
METVDYIQKHFASVKRQFDGVMQDTTEEQINWRPQGTANAIGVTLVHMAGTMDNAFQKVLQGSPLLWESAGWGEKLGLSGLPGRVHGWDEIKSKHLALEPVLEYVAAVFSLVDTCLSGLNPADLERLVTVYGSERPVADLLIMQFSHALTHTGEIAALKGIQGVKGLPV